MDSAVGVFGCQMLGSDVGPLDNPEGRCYNHKEKNREGKG